MEIIIALGIIVGICFVPTAAYLAYTAKRPEPFLNRR